MYDTVEYLKSNLVQKNNINYDQLAQEIFISLRGTLSQRELSSKLGYSFNQVGKWESGHARIKWDHFCDLVELDNKHIEKFIFGDDSGLADFDYRSDIVKIYVMKNSLHVMHDPHKKKLVKKYLSSKSKSVDFSVVLELLDLRTNILIHELSHFVDCEKINLLKSRYDSYIYRLNALYQYPKIPIIRACLLLDTYKRSDSHDDIFIGIHSGASLTEIRDCLVEMQNHGEIEYIDGKFKVIGPGYSFSSIVSDHLKGFNKKVIELSAQKFPLKPSEWDKSHNKNQSRGSVFVEAISNEVSIEISDLISEMHGRILEILKKDQTVYKDAPKENIQLIINMSQSTAWLNQEMKNDLGL